MALRAWYKLNGNTRNYGVGDMDLTQATAPTWSAGILGAQALNEGSFSWTAAQAASVMNNTAFSYAAWIYVGTSDTRSMIFGNDSGRMFSMFQYPTKNDFHYSWTYTSGGGSNRVAGVITGALPTGAWTHVCAVYKTGSAKFYINGELRETVSVTMAHASYANATTVIHNNANHRLQDVRVYDHALSMKEVKELSQGLIAHYPMTGYGVDSLPNLFPFTNAYTKSSPYNHTSSAKDGCRQWGAQSLVTVTPGETYYLSLHCDGIPGSHTTGDVVTINFTVWFYLRIIGTTKSVGGYDSAICFSSSNMYLNDPEHQLYVWKWTAPSNAQDITFRTNSYSNGSTSVTLQFWDLKVEKGAYTPFVPGSGQPAYTALGLNSTKLVDVTGHGHDLTWSALPTVVSGSPRYMTASDFNAAAYASRSSFAISLSAFTVSFWFNPRTMANQHFIVGTFDSWTSNGIGIYRDKKDPTYFSIIIRSSTQSSYLSCGQTFTLNAWHHFALTWDNTNIKVYLDGTLNTTKSYSGGTCEQKNLYLGNSMFSGTPASETEECAMSDFRMYATALTADDITALYRAPVSFTNNGEVHSCGIHELPGTNPVSVGKSGVVKAAAVSEVYGRIGNEVRIEPDGSAWVRIVHHADPSSSNLFASSDSFGTWVYKDAKRWFHGKMCDYADRWEFMIIQKADASASTLKYRWVQTKNPNTAAWAEVAASTITKNTGSGYSDFSTGGLYKINRSTFYCANNGTQGNWWGAVGAWDIHQGGIPAWGSVIVKDGGFEDLYIRVDGGANWSYPDNDRVSIVKTDNSLTEYGIVEV